MIGLVYSAADPASANAAGRLKAQCGFEEAELFGRECWRNGDLVLCREDSHLTEAEWVDGLGFDVACFLSKHQSSEGVGAFTTHSLGNWGKDAKMGGRPGQLSYAAPSEMLSMLTAMARIDAVGVERTYEATHHGPLLKTPSLFVEMGGNDAMIRNRALAERLADSVYDALTASADSPSRIAIGIGGIHYPSKFTRMALEKGYAFAHIMPKYAMLNGDGSDNLDMIGQAVERSSEEPEIAVIEWKSINAELRNRALKRLEEIGLDYERI